MGQRSLSIFTGWRALTFQPVVIMRTVTFLGHGSVFLHLVPEDDDPPLEVLRDAVNGVFHDSDGDAHIGTSEEH